MPAKRPRFGIRLKLLAALESTDVPIDAFECSRIAGESVVRIKQALSMALSANAIHVARTEAVAGGARFFYRPGPKPYRIAPMTYDESLKAMQDAARKHGMKFSLDKAR